MNENNSQTFSIINNSEIDPVANPSLNIVNAGDALQARALVLPDSEVSLHSFCHRYLL